MGRFLKIIHTVRDIRESALSLPESYSGHLTKESWQDEFQKVWDIIKPATSLVKLVTPDKVDKIIDEVVILGDEIATGGASENRKSEFIEKFSQAWEYVRNALFITMKFTGDKVDGIIEKIITWGDLISEQKVQQ